MLKHARDYTTEDGARFIVNFTKKRIPNKYLHLISDTEFKLIQDEGQRHVWSWQNVRKETKNEILSLLDEGLSQTDIKDTIGIHKGTVSKIRKQAIKDDLLTPKNKLTQQGFIAVNG